MSSVHSSIDLGCPNVVTVLRARGAVVTHVSSRSKASDAHFSTMQCTFDIRVKWQDLQLAYVCHNEFH